MNAKIITIAALIGLSACGGSTVAPTTTPATTITPATTVAVTTTVVATTLAPTTTVEKLSREALLATQKCVDAMVDDYVRILQSACGFSLPSSGVVQS